METRWAWERLFRQRAKPKPPASKPQNPKPQILHPKLDSQKTPKTHPHMTHLLPYPQTPPPQAIAVASAYRSEWPLLIVCPASLRLNWLSEVTRWLPDLSERDVGVIFTGKNALSAREPLRPVTILSYDLMPRVVAALKGRVGTDPGPPKQETRHSSHSDSSQGPRGCIPRPKP